MRIRLSTRLVLSVIVIEVVMLSILVWNSARLINTSHIDLLEYNVDKRSVLIANILAPALATRDIALIQDALDQFASDPQVSYTKVYDTAGNHMGRVGADIETAKDHLFSMQTAKATGIYHIEKGIELYGQKLGSVRIGYSIAYVEKLTRKTITQNALIAITEILLSILVASFIGYLFTKSLRKLEQGTRALSRDELDYRINLDSNDEVGELARSFNYLADHLSQTRKELLEEKKQLVQQKSDMQTLLDGVNAVLVLLSDMNNCRFSYVSREAENLLGYSSEEWLSEDFLQRVVHADDFKKIIELKNQISNGPGEFTIDCRMRHKNQTFVDVRGIYKISDDLEGLVCRGVLLDVTEQKQNEKRIIYLADHDPLTGLLNRRRFQEELETAINYSDRLKQSGALLFIDLDQFKYINDSKGHHIGDGYLCSVANLLSSKLRKVDTIGRLGGDEFAVILPNITRADTEKMAQSLLQQLSQNVFQVDNVRANVTASIGVAMYPEHATDASLLLAMADAAMYCAKDSGRNKFAVYTENDGQLLSMQSKVQWEQKIRDALENDLFVLHYQPIVELVSGEVSHYELLLRIRDGNELIYPNNFIDVAERFGLIFEIDKWVIRRAINMQSQSEQRNQPLKLALNLSGRNLGNRNLLQLIRHEINSSRADPGKLIFEITETAAIDNFDQATQFIQALHDMGCKLALDDFGVGYSSFHYLKHMNVDMLKIDGAFVNALDQDAFDRVFVQSICEMAKGLNISCIAEFVENENVYRMLQQIGVTYGQGYYLGRPSESP